MSSSKFQEWHLPVNVIAETLAKLQGRSIARCSLVASTWLEASKNPQLRPKLRIERNWHSLGSINPLKFDLKCPEIRATAIKNDRVAFGGGGWLKVWDLIEAKEVTSFLGVPFGSSPCLAFTGDGWLVRGLNQDHGGYIMGWKGDTVFKSFLFQAHRCQLTAIVGVGESLIASAGCDGSIALWKLDLSNIGDPNEEIPLPCEAVLEGHVGPINCLTATQNDRYLISGALDTTIRVWNTQTKTCEHSLKGHLSSVESLAIYDGLLVSGSFDSELFLWKFQEPGSKSEGRFQSNFSFEIGIYSLFFFKNRVISVDKDGEVCVWDVETRGCVGKINFPRRYDSSMVGVWCSMERLVVVSGRHVYIWNFDI
ncbi:hypothetical protein BSKO_02477 [Bryopsis sp. KO-2023]|nr:hypothetical protein BSKO_02477 [Bryopsis sp. KO-2023]